jgi:hypothetical protein
LKEESFGDVYPQKRLPYTIDAAEDLDAQKVLAKIANEYLDTIEKFEYFGWHKLEDHLEEPTRVIPQIINEERARELTAPIHNLQSTYDDYIKHAPLESQDERLTKLRGLISMPLHLLNLVNWFSHLYQRHVYSSKQVGRSHEISVLIDGARIRDIVLNFALFYTGKYLQEGKNLAGVLLGEYSEIDTCELKVPRKLGFHLRPASLVAKLAKHHGTKLSIIIEGREYDARNVLSISMAAGLIARKGFKTVLFKGDKRVLQDLKLLSEYNYGEDDEGNPASLPSQFTHLRA